MMIRYFFIVTIFLSALIPSAICQAVPQLSAKPAQASLHKDPAAVEINEDNLCHAALTAALSQQWETVKLPEQNTCPVNHKLIRWLQLKNKTPASISFSKDFAPFMVSYQHWPWFHMLRKNAEAAINEKDSAANLVTYFQRFPPLTLKGALAYIHALKKQGKRQQALQVIHQTWVEQNFSSEEQSLFARQFRGELSKKLHNDRMKRLLREEKSEQAEGLLPLLTSKDRTWATVCLAFVKKDPEADKQAQKLSPALKQDETVLYEWIKWLRKKDNLKGANMFSAHVKQSWRKAPYWWREQMALAREAISQQQTQLAYQVLRHHPWSSGTKFAEAEWFLGWVALTYLKQPQTAFQHFERMVPHVVTRSERAKAYYWIARAAEAQGNTRLAQSWWQKGSLYTTTFYGQHCAHQLKQCRSVALPPAPSQANLPDKNLPNNELAVAARLLVKNDRGQEALSFLYVLNKQANTPFQRQEITLLIQEIWPNFLVEAIKIQGELNTWSYPIPQQWIDAKDAYVSLILAIIRQESDFNPHAESPAKAMGLMQLIAPTAKVMAQELDLPFNVADLKQDPQYNVRLGTAYAKSRLNKYKGSLVLTLASYNAGSKPVNNWIERYGDPRDPEIDLIQWIEQIPYSQTRDYVKHVLSNMVVYQQLLAGKCQGPIMARQNWPGGNDES